MRKVLELMHTDLCGKTTPEGINGELYAKLLTDDYSGAIWVSCMSQKSEVPKSTRNIVLADQKLTGKKVVTIRTDGGKEFTMANAKKFLDENCTVLDEIPPYFIQSNGRAE